MSRLFTSFSISRPSSAHTFMHPYFFDPKIIQDFNREEYQNNFYRTSLKLEYTQRIKEKYILNR